MTVLKSLLLVLLTSRLGVNGKLSQNDVLESTGYQETKLSFPAHLSAANGSNSPEDITFSMNDLFCFGFLVGSTIISYFYSSFFGHKPSYVEFRSGVKPAPRFLAIQDLLFLLYPCTWTQMGLVATFLTYMFVLAGPVIYTGYLLSPPSEQTEQENRIKNGLRVMKIEAFLQFVVKKIQLLDQYAQNRSSGHEMGV